jgi:CHAT domain-containing protein
LEYALGEERSYLWAVSTTGLVSFELPARSVIEEATLRLRDHLIKTGSHAPGETPKQRRQRLAQAEQAYRTQAAALSRMLLAPAASRLGTKRLLIVGDGALQYLPFAALPAPVTERRRDGETERRRDGENPQSAIHRPQSFTPLILKHEIVSLPSASTLAALRRDLAGRPLAPKTVAVLADPVFEPTDLRVNSGARAVQAPASAPPSTAPERVFPRLPYTKREAASIIALAPAHLRKLALGFEVNHQTATSEELGAYRYVHFATHGWVDNARPALSAILLSMVDEEGRRREDGLLRLGEIYNLKLPVEMVTLSACSTAVGENIKGEGLMGLTRGFMYAGAARVTASLWQADDQATAELMKRFYEGMLGEPRLRPAAALRAAQIAMSKQKQWQAPYYWAAFALQGEWR